MVTTARINVMTGGSTEKMGGMTKMEVDVVEVVEVEVVEVVEVGVWRRVRERSLAPKSATETPLMAKERPTPIPLREDTL